MTTLRFIALVIASALATIAFVGCAPTTAYVAARNVETGAAAFVNAGADVWHAYSHEHLENCLAACGDDACFKTVVTQWEDGAVKTADKSIVTARDAVHELDTSLAASDATKAKDYSAAVSKVIAVVTEFYNTLTGLGAKLPAFKVQ